MHNMGKIDIFELLQSLGSNRKSGRPREAEKHISSLSGKEVNVEALKPEQWLFQNIIRNIGN